jgi:hypothetical protein
MGGKSLRSGSGLRDRATAEYTEHAEGEREEVDSWRVDIRGRRGELDTDYTDRHGWTGLALKAAFWHPSGMRPEH